jgi:hypothetical protein
MLVRIMQTTHESGTHRSVTRERPSPRFRSGSRNTADRSYPNFENSSTKVRTLK